MPFIPDKQTGFVPDKKSGFVPDKPVAARTDTLLHLQPSTTYPHVFDVPAGEALGYMPEIAERSTKRRPADKEAIVRDLKAGMLSHIEKSSGILGKALSYPVAAGRKGLGVLAWPLERLDYSIATPLSAMMEARRKTFRLRRDAAIKRGVPIWDDLKYVPEIAEDPRGMLEPGTGLRALIPPGFRGGAKALTREETLREWKETRPSLVAALKSWIPGKEPPAEVKTYDDLAGNLYETISGDPAPQWYKTVFGTAASFLTSPVLAAKITKGLGAMARLTGVPQKIAAKTLPLWKRGKMIAKAEVGQRTKEAKDIGKMISGRQVRKLAKELTKATGKPISVQAVEHRLEQLGRGSITVGKASPLAQAIHPAIEQFEANAKTLRELGILGKETFLTKLPKKRIAELMAKRDGLRKTLVVVQKKKQFAGKAGKIREIQGKIEDVGLQLKHADIAAGGAKYMPRMYRSKEAERLATKFAGWSKSRIRAHYAKQRKQIPHEVRKIMGEIKEPGYPVTKRLIQQAHDIETAKLYKFAADQPGWASKTWQSGMAKNPLPNDKAYGALKGMYVHSKLFSDIKEMHRQRSNVEQLYDTAIGAWKLGKVVWNPATHFRNKISNKILLDLSGMGYIEQAKYATKGLWHARKNTIEYQTAKKYFAGTTQVKGELLDDILKTTGNAKGAGFAKGLNSVKRVVKKGSDIPGKLYQHEEFSNKFMKYLQQRDKGKSVVEAVEEANKWLFDYSDLAAWESKIARRIMPFYTFPRKALPRVLEAAVERPLTLAKYPLAAEAMTRYSLAKLKMTDKDYDHLAKVLPDYMDKGSYMLMPFRDKNGDLQFFDWTYVLPWGELSQVGETSSAGNILLSNPMVRIAAELATNKSVWSGRKIFDDAIPLEEQTKEYRREQTAKKMKYVWGTIAPSLAPKGLYWDRLIDAAKGRPKKTITGEKKKMLLPQTIAHTIFGLRTQPIDVKEQEFYRATEVRRKIKEIRGKLMDIGLRKRSGNITNEEYTRREKIYLDQIESISKKAKQQLRGRK